MIKVHDNRTSNEVILDKVEPGKFFMINDILYRKCWYGPETFDCFAYEPDTVVCMSVESGELVLWRYGQIVTPIRDRQIELIVED